MYTKHKWEHDIFYNFKYVRYLPKEFDKNKKYPLVFFLHGAGERGHARLFDVISAYISSLL